VDQLYGDKPYIYHLDCVAISALEGCDGDYSDVLCAVAYLHDILEDTKYTEEYLRLEFPEEVADAVVAITKVKGEKYFVYIQKVATNKLAHKVKMHDTLCNLTESLNTEQWRRVEKYSEQLRLLSMLT
jgi:(p)ppGpp synthase/HD superfamily hydrolase